MPFQQKECGLKAVGCQTLVNLCFKSKEKGHSAASGEGVIDGGALAWIPAKPVQQLAISFCGVQHPAAASRQSTGCRFTCSMCALHSKLNGGLAAAPARARAAPAVVRSGHHQRVVVAAASKWKVFGPTNSYSDGDAEFYRVSNSLAQQYEWFAPRPEEQDNAAAEEELLQQDPRKPLYGLTPQQIAALGLSGNRVNTPDPVSAQQSVDMVQLSVAAAPGLGSA